MAPPTRFEKSPGRKRTLERLLAFPDFERGRVQPGLFPSTNALGRGCVSKTAFLLDIGNEVGFPVSTWGITGSSVGAYRGTQRPKSGDRTAPHVFDAAYRGLHDIAGFARPAGSHGVLPIHLFSILTLASNYGV